MSLQTPQPSGERGDEESGRVPRSLESVDSADVPLGDANCLRCSYNLRGLSGRYVRCPECFHANRRDLVSGAAIVRRRMRELQGAGDAIVMAVVCFIVAALLHYLDGRGALVLPLLAGGALLVYHAVAASRRLGREIEDWSAHWTRYLILTTLVPCAPLAVWLASAIVVWLVRTAGKKSSGIDFVDIFIAIAPTIVLIFAIRPLRRLRLRQRRAFARLMRLTFGTRSAPALPAEGWPVD